MCLLQPWVESGRDMSVPPSKPLPTINPSSWPLQVLDRCLVKFFNFTVSRLAASAQYLPSMRKRLKALQVIKDIPFGPHREHTLDIYAPPDATLPNLDTLKELWRSRGGAADEVDQSQQKTYSLSWYHCKRRCWTGAATPATAISVWIDLSFDSRWCQAYL